MDKGPQGKTAVCGATQEDLDGSGKHRGAGGVYVPDLRHALGHLYFSQTSAAALRQKFLSQRDSL